MVSIIGEEEEEGKCSGFQLMHSKPRNAAYERKSTKEIGRLWEQKRQKNLKLTIIP